jgi:hypothetical protein
MNVSKKGFDLVGKDFNLSNDPKWIPISVTLQIGDCGEDFRQSGLEKTNPIKSGHIMLVIVGRFALRLSRQLVKMSQKLSSLAFYRGRVIRANPSFYCINHILGRGRQLCADVKNTLRDETLIPGCIVHG